MNKQELIGVVAAQTGLSKGDATKAVDGVFDAITDALKKNDEVRHFARMQRPQREDAKNVKKNKAFMHQSPTAQHKTIDPRPSSRGFALKATRSIDGACAFAYLVGSSFDRPSTIIGIL